MEVPTEMDQLYDKAKELIDSKENIKIYSHIDCDGISAGAILSIILDRLNKPHEIEFVNLDVLEDLDITHSLTIFSDLGSGQNIDKYADDNHSILILDHHPPLREKNPNIANYLEINPLHFGIDGGDEICGGGLCYLLARKYGFTDLSWIGVLAAVGDMQNSKNGELVGLNEFILNDAVEEGYIDVHKKDLNIYGRKTRPLFVALSYFSDVKLPITNNKTETIALLESLDIPRKDEKNKYRTLNDLTDEEKKVLFSKLVEMLSRQLPAKYIQYIPKLILADTYDLLMEEEGTFLRDISEFTTAMNACGRNNEEEIALEILKGDRNVSLDNLETVTKRHKRNLARAISDVTGNENTIFELDNFQYFDGTGIKPEIVGTVTGMILGSCNWRKPIIGFTQTESEMIKISLRCSRLLAYEGIHFGNIIRDITKDLGGSGGGHSVACGAYIPIDKKDEFLTIFNEKLNGIIDG